MVQINFKESDRKIKSIYTPEPLKNILINKTKNRDRNNHKNINDKK